MRRDPRPFLRSPASARGPRNLAGAAAPACERKFGKVYIDGIGMMKDGRRLRDGREKPTASGCIEIGHRQGAEAAHALAPAGR
jgi:hypothetical protein